MFARIFGLSIASAWLVAGLPTGAGEFARTLSGTGRSYEADRFTGESNPIFGSPVRLPIPLLRTGSPRQSGGDAIENSEYVAVNPAGEQRRAILQGNAPSPYQYMAQQYPTAAAQPYSQAGDASPNRYVSPSYQSIGHQTYRGAPSECCPPPMYDHPRPSYAPPDYAGPSGPMTMPAPTDPAQMQPLPPYSTGEVTTPATEEFMAGSFDAPPAVEAIAPNMIGDSFGSAEFSSSNSVANVKARTATRFKIADNTSPDPQTRYFGAYHFFNHIFGSGAELHRGVQGVEFAMLGDTLSVDVRSSLNGFDNLTFGPGDGLEAGNLVTTAKLLIYQDQTATISGGLSVQWQTGPLPPGYSRDNHILSPFVGYLATDSATGLFLQGFEQFDFPFESDDQSILQSSVGVGVWVYENPASRFITRIAPTVELHLYTPLGDEPDGTLAGLTYFDVLNTTVGTTFYLGATASIATAIGVPITSNRDYEIEAQILFNWFFGAAIR